MRHIAQFLLVLIPILGTSVLAEDNLAAVREVMTAEQKSISDKMSVLDAAVVAAQKKAAESNNTIELSDARAAVDKYAQEIMVILGKPVKNWGAVVESVSAGRRGSGYTVRLNIPLCTNQMSSQSAISIAADSKDDAIVSALKELKSGDIVRFSGKYDGARALRTLHFRDFALESIEVVKGK